MLRGVGMLSVRPWKTIAARCCSTSSPSALESAFFRSMKKYDIDISDTKPTTTLYKLGETGVVGFRNWHHFVKDEKLMDPFPFSTVDSTLDINGPALKRTYANEEINIYVIHYGNVKPEVDIDDFDALGRLFLRVDILKYGKDDVLHILCGMYPDGLGIHSIEMRSKLELSQLLVDPCKYGIMKNMTEHMIGALHLYMIQRGVDNRLHRFLHGWAKLRRHRILKNWFASIKPLINEMATLPIPKSNPIAFPVLIY